MLCYFSKRDVRLLRILCLVFFLASCSLTWGTKDIEPKAAIVLKDSTIEEDQAKTKEGRYCIRVKLKPDAGRHDLLIYTATEKVPSRSEHTHTHTPSLLLFEIAL
jgi:hypothetical protein